MLNEHCLSPTNRQTDRKAESDFKTVSADILPSSVKWLSWALVTGRVCHQQCPQCFSKGVTVLFFTQIPSKMWLSLWGEGAAYRFCESTADWWKNKGSELTLKRYGSRMETCVWDSNYSVQL